MMCQPIFTLEIGDLYVFTNQDDSDRFWGIFEGHDAAGHIILEAASTDFDHFHRHMALPDEYQHMAAATRSELRDFAYNMGYYRI